MKRMVAICLLALALSSPSYAADNDSGYGTVIAIEVRAHGQFNGVVGRLEYTGRTIDIVTFKLSERVIVLPQVCELLEKTTTNRGIHSLKCRNQYGATLQGTIDFRDRAKPTVTLVGEGGHVYTNISKEAREMAQTYIRNIELGF